MKKETVRQSSKIKRKGKSTHQEGPQSLHSCHEAFRAASVSSLTLAIDASIFLDCSLSFVSRSFASRLFRSTTRSSIFFLISFLFASFLSSSCLTISSVKPLEDMKDQAIRRIKNFDFFLFLSSSSLFHSFGASKKLKELESAHKPTGGAESPGIDAGNREV